MLPDGFRDCGDSYPLPSSREELQKLAAIPVPAQKRDSGCIYLKRATKEWKRRQGRAISANLDIAYREHEVRAAHRGFRENIKEIKANLREVVDTVRQEAAAASASLTDLFALGRKGLEGQMQAHLDGGTWQGEKISASAFRQCFQMVTQAVKGLGLPDPAKKDAQGAILEQAAAAMKATQEAIALAPGARDSDDDSETKH